jgi:hypothetical protein
MNVLRVRRFVLKYCLLAPLVAAAPPARAGKKMSLAQAGYQPTPNKRQRCATCTAYVRPREGERSGTCRLIEGNVGSNGWCRYFTGPQ